MNIIRNGVIVFGVVFTVVILLGIDFENFNWSNNRSDLIGLTSSIGMIVSMILSNYSEKKTHMNKS